MGNVLPLTPEQYWFFKALEKAIRTNVPGVGSLLHEDFRQFQTERRQNAQRCFCDGDLIESFLDMVATGGGGGGGSSSNSLKLAEAVVRQLNDDINAASGDLGGEPGSSSSTLSRPASVLFQVCGGRFFFMRCCTV